MPYFLKKALLIGCLVMIYFTAHAQSIQTITGQVVNVQGEPLFGNAIVISPTDSSIIQGTPFLEGTFTLTGLNNQQVLLKLSSLTFRDTILVVRYATNAHVDLGRVRVREAANELDEVTVTAKQSLVNERPDGSLAINIANTPLATATSVDEILSRSPTIVYDEDGNLQVFGKGAAILFINGVRVANERLSTLSPSDIQTIEIISNPGPRYDAEGNAVINIITRTNREQGGQGAIKNYYSYSDFTGYDNRTDIAYSYAQGNWSTHANYGLQLGHNRHIQRTSRTRNIPNNFFRSTIKNDWQYEYDNLSNYGVGLQYNVAADHYFSVQYTGAYEDLGGQQLSDNTIEDSQVIVYNTNIARDDLTQKNTLNANYYRKMDSLGSSLFIGSQFAGYANDFDNDITESSAIDDIAQVALINNVGGNDINIFSTQLDYTKVFSKRYHLEWGGKYGYVQINSRTTFFDLGEGGTRTRDEDLSSSFAYRERVPAAYLNLQGNITDNIDYGVGLRTELTDYTLFTEVDGGRTIGDTYFNVFPSASLTARLSEQTNVYVTYTSRIVRPPYQTLNPFVVYQDAFTSIRGNPDLQPSRVHALEAGGAWAGLSLKLGYNYTIDPIDGGAFQSEDNPREYILQRVNLSERHAFFGTLSKNINLAWWRSNNTATLSFDRLFDNTGVFAVNNSEPYYYLYSQNSFDIKDWFTLYLTAWYLSDKRDGINFEKDYSSVNLGVEKKLLGNSLTCNLDFNDVFYRVRASGEYRVGQTDVIYDNVWNTHYVRFSVAYNFGRLKELNYRNKNVGESESQRAR
ncbi:TonB-dependent receptor domain-containing protein [Tunicatimonas pelagia]|uniref:TonB-dependent receptor domain-containing protein n=1 Tax=Tunicatimonas pelagia TaxID=931531 RepID=UPI002666F158|nr:TonB-dependent receptor [Tunicatimonas pelagia]WKN45647.1 TonB-dependent receptor [Tunicatimonas pelagia]